jgi:hypothetical protein
MIESAQGAMPTGSVARSFPKEENELRAVFARGLNKLKSIEKQVCDRCSEFVMAVYNHFC